MIVTYFIANKLANKGTMITDADVEKTNNDQLPGFFPAISGPLVAILLLALSPLFDITIDPMIAFIGGAVGALVMKKGKQLNEYAISGLGKMTGVAIMLLGTGTLAGIIQNSSLADLLTSTLNAIGLPAFALAPVAGIFMSAATHRQPLVQP